MTFMKHFEDDINSIDRDNLWAYEGVVLPGGRIMLGRWWFASVSSVLVYAIRRLACWILSFLDLGQAWLGSFADCEVLQDDDVDFDNDYGGPFIFWAVEPEPEVEGDGDDDDDE